MENKQTGRSRNRTAPFETQGKVRQYYAPLQQIRRLFLSGNPFFARQLNALTGSNDARKCISTLRRQGMDIKGEWFDRIKPNAKHNKLYWLNTGSEKCLQSIEKSAGGYLPASAEKTQQRAASEPWRAASEPTRVGEFIAGVWMTVMYQRAVRHSSGKEACHEGRQ